jgi:hypothetical protein
MAMNEKLLRTPIALTPLASDAAPFWPQHDDHSDPTPAELATVHGLVMWIPWPFDEVDRQLSVSDRSGEEQLRGTSMR